MIEQEKRDNVRFAKIKLHWTQEFACDDVAEAATGLVLGQDGPCALPVNPAYN